MTAKTQIRIAAFVMIVGIVLGAFGAHGLRESLDDKGMEVWKTAVLYQLIHGIALFILAAFSKGKTHIAFFLWLVGILLFSGSLYFLAMGAGSATKILGPITPLGGLSFIIGWIWLLISPPKFQHS